MAAPIKLDQHMPARTQQQNEELYENLKKAGALTLFINDDMPAHRAKVMFRNQSKPCFVLHPDKLASDAKTFREIAGMIRGVSPRGTLLANWLETMGEEYSNI